MKQEKSRLLMLTIMTFFILATCNKSEDKIHKEAQKQVLNVTIAEEMPSLDVAKAMDGTSAHVMQNIFEGLYVLDRDDKPIPGVAESFEKSGDGKKYTFHLRKNAKWSNGESVTAHDFIFLGSEH